MQAALNLPQDLICQAVLAKHCAPPAHCSVVAHSAPSFKVPGEATTVADGAAWIPPPVVWAGITDEVDSAIDEAVAEVEVIR